MHVHDGLSPCTLICLGWWVRRTRSLCSCCRHAFRTRPTECCMSPRAKSLRPTIYCLFVAAAPSLAVNKYNTALHTYIIQIQIQVICSFGFQIATYVLMCCVMCRFQHVLCPDLDMTDVKICACLMCRFIHVLCAGLCMCYVNYC